ncbi:hypothetical protein PJP10_31335, partial [Mycobacterium kansasii]
QVSLTCSRFLLSEGVTCPLQPILENGKQMLVKHLFLLFRKDNFHEMQDQFLVMLLGKHFMAVACERKIKIKTNSRK